MEKVDTGSFKTLHPSEEINAGRGGFSTSAPLINIPPLSDFEWPGFPEPEPNEEDPLPGDAAQGDVIYDFEEGEFFALEDVENEQWTQVTPAEFEVTYDTTTKQLGVFETAGDSTVTPIDTLKGLLDVHLDDPAARFRMDTLVDIQLIAGVLDLLLDGLPTADPGGGKVWLSAT